MSQAERGGGPARLAHGRGCGTIPFGFLDEDRRFCCGSELADNTALLELIA
jgi:hypothetical protein